MTEYGRGPGSEPWHPEDPLYGDGGWGGQQAHGAQSPYGGHPQQPQQQQQHYGDWGGGQSGGYDQGQQQYPQQYPGPYPGQGQDPYQQQGGQPYQQPGQQYPPQMQQGQGQGNGGWVGGGQGDVPYPGDPADPYGTQGGPQAGAHGGGQSDYYQSPEAYPPSEPQPSEPQRRRAEPEPETDWDPGPDRGEHAFFAGDDEDDGHDDEPDGRRGRAARRGRGGKEKKEKKGRSGSACLIVVLILGGGIGGIGYVGYQYYQSHFGSAPDYEGQGTSELVTVTIPRGAVGSTIGQALKKAGVVKSVDAFVAAQQANPRGNAIQAGTYTLHKHMSAASAVELMLSPQSKNNLIIAEGWRNAKIYEAIDERLKLKAGTTKGIAESKWKSLGLPDWANTDKDIKDPLEGFLYPSSYPVSKGMKPEDVLKQMVGMANEKYTEYGIKEKADSLDLQNPLQVLTVASLVQAEGRSKRDFEKVATVVYNRLKPDNTETNGLLDFDSTVNYLRGESKLGTGSVDDLRKIDDPYNTYRVKGLPPGPIDNPGEVAIKAALHPAKGNWYYFVAINGKTVFAETNAEQNRNREKYLEDQKQGQ
ncbi:endolytic transglycosylase MltG [Streptomyces sp. RY43-2]|uniref:Endolytic murein transglycosylase n=1 Tax=Streptomyces macrolidinus TaxID=2952607 RepID=A0ABT0ZC32_9ACTN|nr:endolytic transglycosylase MltG [Streptomyces macrolidinus]MCN9240782.1 endolytic transglycosylase MltG [Streptomyces macrolidinus]